MTSSAIGMSHELANTLNVQAALDELVKILIASIATPRWYRPQCPLPCEGNVCLNVRLEGAKLPLASPRGSRSETINEPLDFPLKGSIGVREGKPQRWSSLSRPIVGLPSVQAPDWPVPVLTETNMTEVTEIAASTESARGASPRRRTATRKERSEKIAETTPAATRRRARRAASSSKGTGNSPATTAEPTPPQSVEKGPAKPKKPTKQAVVLALLKRPDGATIDELMEATAWQAHSVRGFLSAVVRKKLALTLISDVVGNGIRRYRIAEAEHEPDVEATAADEVADDMAPPVEEASSVPITEAPIGTAA